MRSPQNLMTVPGNSSFRGDSGNLDLIRPAAVLCVFFSHLYTNRTGDPSRLGWHFGQMGVLIFFVHTSMVLMLSLERTKAHGKAMFGNFYLRRLFRIYPLSMFCVTLAMLFHYYPDLSLKHPVRDWKWFEYFANMSLTINLAYVDGMVGGIKTLPLEVQMYLALPFLFLLGRTSSTMVVFLAWLVSLPIAILQPHLTARLNVLGYAPCFISGVVAWKLSRSIKRRLPGSLWPLAFVATWPVFLAASKQDHMYFRWAFCILLGVLIPWFEELTLPPLKAMSHVIAKYSYGIYLSHIALIMWSFSLPVSLPLQWTVFVVLALITPVAMYHLIEHPLILLGQKVAERVYPAKVQGQGGRVNSANPGPGVAVSNKVQTQAELT